MATRITADDVRRRQRVAAYQAELKASHEHAQAAEAARGSRRRAAQDFVHRWQDNTDKERSEAQTFWNELFAVLGVDRLTSGAKFEDKNPRRSTGKHGFSDLFLEGVLLVEHKSRGKDLQVALGQADDYDLEGKTPPRLTVACDFATFHLRDNHTGNEVRFTLAELPDQLGWFGPLHAEDPCGDDARDLDLKAVQTMTNLYDQLVAVHALGGDVHQVQVLLTRLLFCFFADDSGIWREGAFDDVIGNGGDLNTLFWVLNTPDEDPQRLSLAGTDYAAFPYVNGGLFAETLRPFVLTPSQREAVLTASRDNDWSKVSPAVFGSMFQGVMDGDERHSRGAHYTSETNIRRVIDPLFLDSLYQQVEDARTVETLDHLWTHIAGLKFLDPACGCGNFLVVAYQELRALERRLMQRIADLATTSPRRNRYLQAYPWLGDRRILFGKWTRLTIDHFHGIEIDPWPAQIAQVSMWLTDHLANMQLEAEFGGHQTEIPINSTVHITVGNALRLNWNTVLPAADCSYVMGNPPFLGARWMSKEQKHDLVHVWGGKAKRVGDLDFVTGWYCKAADYIDGQDTRVAFVSTNSITQGMQPALMWEPLYEKDIHIDFAYRSFHWRNEARSNAGVTVVIIGMSQHRTHDLRALYTSVGSGTDRLDCSAVNAYLLPMEEVLLQPRPVPLSPGQPRMLFGSMPNDAGHLSNISPADADLIRHTDPVAAHYLRRLIGADELLNGRERWCLWLDQATPADIRASGVLRQRCAEVRQHRASSRAATTRDAQHTPHLFFSDRQPQSRYLAVPLVSSGNRRYVPIAHVAPDVIANSKLFTIEGADDYLFGVLMSSAFNTWNRAFSGRMRTDYSISAAVTYNTFPFPPDPSEAARLRVSVAARGVLDARGLYPDATLAELYGPGMPKELTDAHRRLDTAVIQAYHWPTRTPTGAPGDPDHEMQLLTQLVAEYQRQLATEDRA